jgi:hypothetical protein
MERNKELEKKIVITTEILMMIGKVFILTATLLAFSTFLDMPLWGTILVAIPVIAWTLGVKNVMTLYKIFTEGKIDEKGFVGDKQGQIVSDSKNVKREKQTNPESESETQFKD